MDETYINVKGQWKYYYRAVDKDGDMIDFILFVFRNNFATQPRRQPFLLPIEKGFEWFIWMHRQEDTCLCR